MTIEKLFTVAGVSKFKGEYKIRYATDIGRIKVLSRHPESDPHLVELPSPMTKRDATIFLQTTSLAERPEFLAAMIDAEQKYTLTTVVKAVKVPKTKAKSPKTPNLDDIKLRIKKVSEAEKPESVAEPNTEPDLS